MNNTKLTKYYSDCAILVLSCDKYSDLWKPFFSQFEKFWPDCPFKVYLGSNTKKYPSKKIISVLSHGSVDWSSDLFSILGSMKEQYIFVWLEDLFPTTMINNENFEAGFAFLRTQKASHIHIAPYVYPDGISTNKLFGYYEKGAPYRVTVPGFWNKNQLQSLLIKGENPWQFEIMGSYRSMYYEGFYTMMKPVFNFIRIVDKGLISEEALLYCKAHGINLDLKNRHVFSKLDKLKCDIQGLFFQLVLHIPWKYRVNLVNHLRRLAVSY